MRASLNPSMGNQRSIHKNGSNEYKTVSPSKTGGDEMRWWLLDHLDKRKHAKAKEAFSAIPLTELVPTLERPSLSCWTDAGAQLLQGRAMTSLTSCSLSSTAVSTAQQHILVKRAPLHDFFSFVSSIPVNSRTSVEAMLEGTRTRMIEMRLKMQHRFPRPRTQEKSLDHAGLIGVSAATDLDQRHLLTLDGTLGSDADRQSMSTFVSSKFESRVAWGLAISHRVHRTLTFFSRYNCDDHARNQFILQVVHKLNEKTTLSTIVSVSTGGHPQAGFSLTRQLTGLGIFGDTSLQGKGFCSGGGAYSVSIKTHAGQVD